MFPISYAESRLNNLHLEYLYKFWNSTHFSKIMKLGAIQPKKRTFLCHHKMKKKKKNRGENKQFPDEFDFRFKETKFEFQ